MLTTIDDKNLYDIADAIREVKGVEDTYTPGEMASAIGEIAALPEDALVITGDCDYRCAYNGWNWFIEGFGDKITTKDIGNKTYMFYNSSGLENIPFTIDGKAGIGTNCKEMFSGCSNLKTMPKFTDISPTDLTKFMNGCRSIRELPEDFAENFDWGSITGSTNAYGANRSYVFYNCYSLRSFPMDYLKYNNPVINNSYCMFYYGFTNCYALDELVGIPISWHTGNWTSNAFYTTFDNCSRLQSVTFETQADGTPYTMNWKSQTIDLSKYVGYASSTNNITNYNSGLTLSTRVNGSSDYATRSQDPDWWTTNLAYSRYNHDSAVETINSLPDTSAYGTNTIKFKSGSGSSTTGGSVSDLTAEEIAVATAKGWTVSLV